MRTPTNAPTAVHSIRVHEDIAALLACSQCRVLASNALTVGTQPPQPDSSITATIKEELAADQSKHAESIVVTTNGAEASVNAPAEVRAESNAVSASSSEPTTVPATKAQSKGASPYGSPDVLLLSRSVLASSHSSTPWWLYLASLINFSVAARFGIHRAGVRCWL